MYYINNQLLLPLWVTSLLEGAVVLEELTKRYHEEILVKVYIYVDAAGNTSIPFKVVYVE